MSGNINTTNSLELGALMGETFLTLPFFSFYLYLPKDQNLSFVQMDQQGQTSQQAATMENSQRGGTEISALESLSQSNQEMEELLANLEERIPEVYTLERY